MSHLTKIELAINDLNSLEKAVKRLGGELKRNQNTYKWFGQFMGDSPLPAGMTKADLGKCDHAISFPNARYEIGVVKSKTSANKFELLYDYWSSGGLDRIVGKDAGMLKQAYAIEVAKKQAINSGFTTSEKTLKDGSIQLKVMVN